MGRKRNHKIDTHFNIKTENEYIIQFDSPDDENLDSFRIKL